MIPLTTLGYELKVVINNVKSDQGNIWIELLDVNKDSFKDTKIRAQEGVSIMSFKGLPEGKYAVRLFHDENVNDELDTNFIGIPKEGYGFSNDAHGRFGPYDFKKWLIEVKKDETIQVNLEYL